MIGLIENPPPQRRAKLCLHCGANEVRRSEVALTNTPRPTATWQPIPHMDLIEEVEHALAINHLRIGNVAHSLSSNGDRYFGLMEIRHPGFLENDYACVLGIRNSHDKTFPAGLVAGANVFVCDNLSFSGEIRVARKHTRFIRRDLVPLVQSSIGKLMTAWRRQDERIEAYKACDIVDEQVHDIVIRSVDAGVLPNRKVPDLLRHWREPIHEEFRPRNVWSLFNGYTEVLKGNLVELPKRTERLHGLLDCEAGWCAN